MGDLRVLVLILGVQCVHAFRHQSISGLEIGSAGSIKQNLMNVSGGGCPEEFWTATAANKLMGGSSAIKPIAIQCSGGKKFVLKPQNTKKVPPNINADYHQLQEVAGAQVTSYITAGHALVPKPITVTARHLNDLSAAMGVKTTDWMAALNGTDKALPAQHAIVMPFFDGKEMSDHIAELYDFQWVPSDGHGVVDLSASSVACDDATGTCDITTTKATIPRQNSADMVRVTMKRDIPDTLLIQLFSHMLADYVIGNTDFHTGNYMIGPSGASLADQRTSVVALDKGQAFRYFRSNGGTPLNATPWWDTTDGVTLRGYAVRKNGEHFDFRSGIGQVPVKPDSRQDPQGFCPFWHMNFQYQVLGVGNLPLSGPLVNLLNSIRIKEQPRWAALMKQMWLVVNRVKDLPTRLADMPSVMAFGQLSYVADIMGEGGFIEELVRRSKLPLGLDSTSCPVEWGSNHMPATKEEIQTTLRLLFQAGH